MLWGYRFILVLILEDGFYEVDYVSFYEIFEVFIFFCSVRELVEVVVRFDVYFYWFIFSRLDEKVEEEGVGEGVGGGVGVDKE